MRSATTSGQRPAAARLRDEWDEEESAEDEEYGPSWTKAYVGGMKVRQYGDWVAAAPATVGSR